MNKTLVNPADETLNYGELFHTDLDVKIIKKDGSLENFNVQKVIIAVGKSAYRALTSFTHEEKLKICLLCVYVYNICLSLFATIHNHRGNADFPPG